jgi:hypothetical protein
MIKKIQLQFLLAVSICLFAFSPAWGWRQKITGIVHEETILISPTMKNSPNKKRTYISCYDAWTGEELDCPYTQEVKGLAEPYVGGADAAIMNNGGHTHNYDTRPFFYPADGGLVSAFDLDPDKKRVASSTYSSFGLISHAMPEVSGVIVTETLIESPKGWECASGCFTDTSWKDKTNLNVAVYETKTINSFIGWSWYTFTLVLPLTELPAPSGEDHYLLTGDTSIHPINHYGTGNTVDQLKQIADELNDKTDRNLSINDISLPKGGLFDWKADKDIKYVWNPPHSTHRTGIDTDIDVGNKTCYEDQQLRRAVEKVSGGKTSFPLLRCECKRPKGANKEEEEEYKKLCPKDYTIVDPENKTGYWKHIDFD